MNQKKKFKWINTDDPYIEKTVRSLLIVLYIGVFFVFLFITLAVTADSDNRTALYGQLGAISFGLLIIPILVFFAKTARHGR